MGSPRLPHFNKDNLHSLKKWVDGNIEPIEIVQSRRLFTAALPSAFMLTDASPRINSLKDRFQSLTGANIRLKVIAQRLEATSDSKNESLGQLMKLVYDSFYAAGAINLYQEKPRQPRDILVPGKAYLTIQRGDKLHDHENPDLIDFRFVELFSGRVVKNTPFEDCHSHIIAPQFT